MLPSWMRAQTEEVSKESKLPDDCPTPFPPRSRRGPTIPWGLKAQAEESSLLMFPTLCPMRIQSPARLWLPTVA